MRFLSPPATGDIGDWLPLVLAGCAVLALLVWAIGRLSRRRGPGCRWRRDATGRRLDSLAAWRCRRWGAEAFTASGRAPRDCRRDLRPRPL
ncbi:hypothetical protein V8J36_00710 [Frigidibacter sp. MR17.14]|uniref:hypothetical protein n=1 Tax=Frigidibacter sp. MR17.14 TaxID=3126509 RepID=UPI003012E081